MLKADAQIAGGSTKDRIVGAALETLRVKGFAGTSAREIARAGGFNQALIFYHFGSVTELLLAALDHTSALRMSADETALQDTHTLEDLVAVATTIYREDLASGHITVLSEMIAGSLAHPELGPEIVARMEPWIDFAERAIARGIENTPFANLLPTRDLAYALVAFYLGVDLLSHLNGDETRADRLFALAQAVAPMITTFVGDRQ